MAPNLNAEWWRQMSVLILSRDADIQRMLRAAGWLSLVVREHEGVTVAPPRPPPPSPRAR